MGANAQTSVPTFTAGEVLTAANMNISARTGIPVFADATARDAAFGGTGEKTLAEGQYAYLESTNATQYYDGAAWQSVGTTPGLVCVKAETTATAATSATADSVFTSTYTNYLVLFTFTTSTSNTLSIKLRASGVSTSTNYNFQRMFASSTTVSGSRSTGGTSLALEHTGSAGTGNASVVMNIFQPQLAKETNFSHQLTRNENNFTTGLEQYTFAANQNSSTQFDGIEFLVATGTFTITYSIYGYSKTV